MLLLYMVYIYILCSIHFQSEEVAQAEGQSDAHRESTPQTETEAPTEAEGVTEATDVPAGNIGIHYLQLHRVKRL